MAGRYEDTGIKLVQSAVDDQVWLPIGEDVTVDDVQKCVGRLRTAQKAVIDQMMDPDGFEYRWVKVDDKQRRLEERETADSAA